MSGSLEVILLPYAAVVKTIPELMFSLPQHKKDIEELEKLERRATDGQGFRGLALL